MCCVLYMRGGGIYMLVGNQILEAVDRRTSLDHFSHFPFFSIPSGGLELLFDNQKEVGLDFDSSELPLKDVLVHLRDKVLKERPELFMQDGTV